MRLAFGEDRSFASTTMGIYMRDAPVLAQKVLEAIQNEDNAGLASHAHALKGITGYFTRENLYNVFLDLETLGRDGGLPLQSVHALGLYAAADSLLREMLLSMQNYLDSPDVFENMP